jgi:uncharacterized protein YecT (DUF1311 family)
MKISSIGLAALVFAFTQVPLYAGDGCENPQTSYDRTYCMAKLFVESDKELNVVYKELRAGISKEMKKKLMDVQLEWIKYRDSSCESSGTIDVKCNYDVNRARTEFLRDRVRECKTGQCRNDLIPQKSWEK